MASIALASLTDAHSAQKWVKVNSPHFELLTTAGEKRAREGARFFEQVRALFVSLKINGGETERPVRIVAF